MRPMINVFIAVMAGVMMAGALWLILQVPNLIVFFATLIATGIVFSYFTAFFPKVESRNPWTVLLTLVTVTSFFFLVSLAETDWSKVFFILLGSICIGVLVYSVGTVSFGNVFTTKYARRLVTMLWTFDIFALFSTLYAWNVFFPNWSFWLIGLAGAFVSAAASVAVWKAYSEFDVKKYFLWLVCFGIAIFEIMWTVKLLPLGHFVLGWLSAWLWYSATLLLRFHFSSVGIIWNKQKWFILVSTMLCVSILYFLARWV